MCDVRPFRAAPGRVEHVTAVRANLVIAIGGGSYVGTICMCCTSHNTGPYEQRTMIPEHLVVTLLRAALEEPLRTQSAQR